MTGVWIVVAIILLVILFMIVMYNAMVRFRNRVEVDYAREHDIDRIAIGTRSRRVVARFFPGSVAAEVVRNAPMLVLLAVTTTKRAQEPGVACSRQTV